MSVVSDVKALLTTISNVYIGDMPNSPDKCVCIYPTGGAERSQAGDELKQPSFMVIVRDTSYSSGLTTADSIADILHGIMSGNFALITQSGDINGLGKDEQNRHEFSINFRAYYR